MHRQALRVESAEHTADGTVLAGAVRALQPDQQGLLPACPEQALLLDQPRLERRQLRAGTVVVEAAQPLGVAGRQRARVAQAGVEQGVGQAQHGGVSWR
ncbi:hypothetical protein D3C72_2107370 [compost metagenome]